MRRPFVAALLGTVIAAALSLGGMRAQQGGGGKGGDSGAPAHDPIAKNSSTVNLSTMANPDVVRREVEEAAKEAKIERQKHILKDTAKLLQLAGELKTDVDGTTTDAFSPQTLRKMEQIEKLAHDVKQRTLKK